jgi:hypothetical protein
MPLSKPGFTDHIDAGVALPRSSGLLPPNCPAMVCMP